MHFDFTDMAMVAPLTTTMLGWVGRGGREVHDVSSACVLRFLRSFNHAREPDATAPDARNLERLRAGLLSRTPVSEVLPARQWGFAGGHAFGRRGGVVPADERKTSSAGGDSPGGDSPDQHPNPAEPVGGAPPSGSGPRKGPLSPLRNKLKMPPLPIPNRLRRIRMPPRPPRSGGGAPSSSPSASSSEMPSPAERARRARLLRQYRRSFDATHVPENWMELESIASDSDGETPDGDGGYASGDEGRGTNDDDGSHHGTRGDDEPFDEFATPPPAGSAGFSNAALEGESSPGFVGAESSPLATGLPGVNDASHERRPPHDSPGGFPGRRRIDRGDGDDGIRSRDLGERPGRVRGGSGEAVPEPSIVDRSPYPVEVKPRGVRWVKSHEWALAADREWTRSQRREMRWLLHEATDRGVRLQPSDFVAMFPSFDSAAIRRVAVEELTTLHAHPPPKPLVWMSQMIVDESGELRSKHDRPH